MALTSIAAFMRVASVMMTTFIVSSTMIATITIASTVITAVAVAGVTASVSTSFKMVVGVCEW